MIGDAIKRTRERLEKVKKQRHTQRRQRERRGAFNISLVGYTNAGKSTLFNALVKARTYAANQLFATLDTTTRQLFLADEDYEAGVAPGRTVSLSDTVGFIRDLPHGLIDAFQATLQEAADADLLLHVVDAANPNHPEQIEEVQRVLHEIGASEVRQVVVFNKVDALPAGREPRSESDVFEVEGRPMPRVFVSAQTGAGLAELRRVLAREVLRRDATEGADGPDGSELRALHESAA
jgi:GTP-binding protein HflX